MAKLLERAGDGVTQADRAYRTVTHRLVSITRWAVDSGPSVKATGKVILMRNATRLAIVGLVMAVLVAPSAVLAKDGDVITTGACSNASTWKLKLSDEDLGKEIKIEVDQNVTGDRWKVRILLNGDVLFKGKRTTQAPSGSFKVRRLVEDSPGKDVVKIRARNLTTGETCFARGVF